MSLRKPPALATWLLNGLRLSETNAPLAGDLLEEFQCGRSRTWYWRQTAVAIATLLRRNASSSHGRLTVIFASWVAQVGVAYELWRFHLPSQIGTLPFALAVVFALSIWIKIVLALRKSGLTKLKSALERLAYWSLVPLFGTSAFVVRIGKGRSAASALFEKQGYDSGSAALATTAWSVFIESLGSYCLTTLLVRLSFSLLLLFELEWLIQEMVSAVRPPNHRADVELHG